MGCAPGDSIGPIVIPDINKRFAARHNNVRKTVCRRLHSL